jgi:hypothetical protein
MKTNAPVILPAIFLLAACETVESKNVRTDGIYADLRATADGSGSTVVEASLRVGGSGSNTYLDLSDGDSLLVDHAGDTRRLERSQDFFGAVHYRTSVPTDAADTPLRVAFMREPHDQMEAECRGGSAPYSIATLPSPFSITAPSADAKFSRARDSIVVTWTPSSHDAMRWTASGTCIRNESGDLDGDPGRLELDAGRFEPATDREQSQSCEVTITLIRRRMGMVDPAYGEGGTFTAEQIRKVEIDSEP